MRTLQAWGLAAAEVEGLLFLLLVVVMLLVAAAQPVARVWTRRKQYWARRRFSAEAYREAQQRIQAAPEPASQFVNLRPHLRLLGRDGAS
jgi:flagellar basal body-associated protein FliL